MTNLIEVPDRILIVLPDMKSSSRGAPSWQEDYLIPVSRKYRVFWPPFRIYFNLETDIGRIYTDVAGDSAMWGDPMAGNYIRKGIRPWFRNHSELRVGSILEAKKLEDLLYSLTVLQA